MLIRSSDTRLSETPNAAMTTLASPTLGGATLAMWRVEMAPGGSGPLHAFDVDQIWTIESGGGVFRVEESEHVVGAGDTIVLPAGRLRQVHAHAEGGLRALAVAQAGARATMADGADRGVPPWIA